MQIVGLSPFSSFTEYPITPLCLFKISHKTFTSSLGSKELTIKGKLEFESKNAYLRVEGKGLSSKLGASLGEEGLRSSSLMAQIFDTYKDK